MGRLRQYIPYFLYLLVFLVLVKIGRSQDVGERKEQSIPIIDSGGHKKIISPFEITALSQPIDERNIPDSVINRLKQEDAYWYSDKSPERNKLSEKTHPGSNSIFGQIWFATLVWIVFLTGTLFLIAWALAFGNIRIFRKKSRAIEVYQGAPDDGNLFSLNYEQQLKKALDENDFRQAVRLLYLAALKDLSSLSLIQLRQDKTNNEYLMELENTLYYREFFHLTRNFEYIWYGKFNLTKIDFLSIQKKFAVFKKHFQ
ncbi:MAG: hypothetical protein NVS9B7_22310 [Flavisolibacter sp.]